MHQRQRSKAGGPGSGPSTAMGAGGWKTIGCPVHRNKSASRAVGLPDGESRHAVQEMERPKEVGGMCSAGGAMQPAAESVVDGTQRSWGRALRHQQNPAPAPVELLSEPEASVLAECLVSGLLASGEFSVEVQSHAGNSVGAADVPAPVRLGHVPTSAPRLPLRLPNYPVHLGTSNAPEFQCASNAAKFQFASNVHKFWFASNIPELQFQLPRSRVTAQPPRSRATTSGGRGFQSRELSHPLHQLCQQRKTRQPGSLAGSSVMPATSMVTGL
ncbi:hypothetical protein SKAU_G00239920 [Synaphobranchus kaupii]|uniref:Uncharacterized protein n=1 Tax=Synaphobranchus kaupii TaxID=118154 RepID=A0A9Q1F7D2_SYNKA|nr:hypothetical protein SKAU_G00239920 [Synaphobranchus kaupii]